MSFPIGKAVDLWSNLRIGMCENCDSSWHFKGFFSCWLSTGFTLWATNGCLHCHSYRLIQFELHPSYIHNILWTLQMPSTSKISKSTGFKQSLTYQFANSHIYRGWFKPLLVKPYPCRKPAGLLLKQMNLLLPTWWPYRRSRDAGLC